MGGAVARSLVAPGFNEFAAMRYPVLTVSALEGERQTRSQGVARVVHQLEVQVRLA